MISTNDFAQLLVNEPVMSHALFWHTVRDLMLKHDEGMDAANVELASLMSAERINTPARIESHTELEMRWLTATARRAKPVKIYRCVSLKNLMGYRWHTSLEHALAEPGDLNGSYLVSAYVPYQKIILRMMVGGRKQVIVDPRSITRTKVEKLTELKGE